ncbi:MAG: hypothetical protein KKA99_00275 [Gammaproteobacteria bacterium]|nr:hypothetical protein [Gammaproteobacteria bacterium]MBU1926439.1 hypothetical protein [Gammaproteobacteria bacterium]MBU2545721.1 hypothetical protein [Gammaproteobacteria bacterium]
MGKEIIRTVEEQQLVYLSEEDKKVLETLKQDWRFSLKFNQKEIVDTVAELEIDCFKEKKNPYVRDVYAYRKLMFQFLFDDLSTESFEFKVFRRLISKRKSNRRPIFVCLSNEEKDFLQGLMKHCSLNENFPFGVLMQKEIIEAVAGLECLHFQGARTINTCARRKFRWEVASYLLQSAPKGQEIERFSRLLSRKKPQMLKRMQETWLINNKGYRGQQCYEAFVFKPVQKEVKEVQQEECRRLINNFPNFLYLLDIFLVDLENSVNSLLQQEAVQFFHFVDDGLFHSVSTFFPHTYNEDEEKETSLFSVITNVDQVLQQLNFMMKSSCSHFEMDGFSELEKSFSDLRKQGLMYQNKLSDIFSAFPSEELVKKIRDLFDKSSLLRWHIDTKKKQVMMITESQMRCNDEENQLRLMA